MDKNATESTKSYCKLAKKKQKKKYTVKYIIKLLDRHELSLCLFLPWLLLFLIQFCAFFAPAHPSGHETAVVVSPRQPLLASLSETASVLPSVSGRFLAVAGL